MKTLFTFILTLVSFISFAQNKLSGFVFEQNSGKKPVAEAIIKSFGANPIVSSNNGKFMLTFQGFLVGKNVTVRAEKDGWEIVNEKELNTFIPANPDDKPLKVVLCKAGYLAKAKKEYHNITDEYIVKEYNKKNAAINREKEGWQKEAAILEEQLNHLQKQLDEMADEFSRVNLDDASDIERQAIILFKSGKIDESIKLRESLNSDQELTKAVANKAKLDSTIALHTRNLTDLAKGYILTFDFKMAEKTLEKLALADTTNFENIFTFAYFLIHQNQFDKSLKWLKKSLKLATKDYDIASIQNNLGLIYQVKNDFSLASKAFQKSLEIREALAKNNPEMYESEVADTQNNLGRFYKTQSNYDSALSAYLKALEIYERLAKTNPVDYEPYVAIAQNNLGILYQDKKDHSSALKAHQKAFEIYERLSKKSPATFEPYKADTQNYLGNLYQAKKDYASALTSYQQALEIRERFAGKNPDAYKPSVAVTLNSLGTLYQSKDDYFSALNYFQKALEIIEQLAKTNPDTYKSEIASIQNNLGFLYDSNNEIEKALKAYQIALEIREQFAKINPEKYESHLTVTLNDLGYLYQKINDFPSALKFYQRTLEIRERLAKTHPDIYEPYIASTKNDLGSLYQDKRDYSAALNCYQSALAIRERLAKINHEIYEPDVATTQNNLGGLFHDNYEYSSALNAYQKALEIRERLAKTNPERFEIDLCHTIVQLGFLQNDYYQADRQKMVDDDLNRAKQLLTKYQHIPLAVNLLKDVNKLETYFKFDAVYDEVQLLKTQINEEKNNLKRIKIQEKIILKYQTLANDIYPKFINEIGKELGSLAWFQLFEKQFSEAEKSAKEALNPSQYTKPYGYDKTIEWANTNLALALLFQGKYAEAEKIYLALKDKTYDNITYRETFLADLDELEKAGIIHPDVTKIRAFLKK